jgi:hypothetical protein
MARMSYPRAGEPLPAPLPPETRTVGQLVAESIRLYGRRFWPSLALGIGPAAVGVIATAVDGAARIVLVVVLGPLLFSLSYVGATVIAAEVRGRLAPAVVAGVVAFLPIAVARVVIFPGIYLVVLAWFALVGLSVPAVLVEGLPLRRAFRRGAALGRADFVHAVGSLATLVIAIFLTGLVLFFLIQSIGDQALRVAAFLAGLVLSPLFFLGAALLYVDQAARAHRAVP